jgi:hypothetical protein
VLLVVGTSIIHSQDENNIGAGFLFWIGEPELTTIKDGWGLLSEEVKTWNGANKTRTTSGRVFCFGWGADEL